MSKPSVFLSDSHQDERWKDRLVQQLRILEKEGLLAVWHDRLIGGGGKWYEEIQAAIEGAEVALLLISADFLSSPFILDKEVPALLKRQEEKGLRVIPIILKECPWRQSTFSQIIRLAQAARLLGISRPTLYRWQALANWRPE
ncbi:MAG TPA: TIR domain-containing protein [Thermoanaerobaculia bacterium]|nr:TIR domain-containing protein [Thermoanaerobaculia bacterium]